MQEKLYINGVGIIHPAGNQKQLLNAFAGCDLPADVMPLQDLLPGVSLRRVPKAARLSLHAAALALQNAGLNIPIDANKAARVGVFTGTANGAVENGFGFMDSILEFGEKLASPTAFSYSVNNVFTGMLSLYLGAQGPSYTSGQFALSFAGALQAASSSLLLNGCDYALLNVVEETSDFLKYIYSFDWSGKGGCQSEQPFTSFAASFVISRNNTAGSIEISFPLWGESAAAGVKTDMLFCSAQCKKNVPNAACSIDCSELYGKTPSVQALDVAMAAVALKNNKVPANKWVVSGAAPALANSAACEMYDPFTKSYAVISVTR